METIHPRNTDPDSLSAGGVETKPELTGIATRDLIEELMKRSLSPVDFVAIVKSLKVDNNALSMVANTRPSDEKSGSLLIDTTRQKLQRIIDKIKIRAHPIKQTGINSNIKFIQDSLLCDGEQTVATLLPPDFPEYASVMNPLFRYKKGEIKTKEWLVNLDEAEIMIIKGVGIGKSEIIFAMRDLAKAELESKSLSKFS
jgi:hypothetical protein